MKVLSRIDNVRRMGVLRKRLDPVTDAVCASVRRHV